MSGLCPSMSHDGIEELRPQALSLLPEAIRGAVSLAADASELPGLLQEALQLRRSEATERNPLSSRSHVTCWQVENRCSSLPVLVLISASCAARKPSTQGDLCS